MIAVVIYAHKNFKQVRRLVDSLKHEEIDIFMHVDAKADFDESKFKDINVFSNRADISWGNLDNAKLDSVFSNLKEVLDTNKYERFIYMSGQDYPIVNVDKIVKFFKNNKYNYLSYGKITEQHVKDRYLKYRFKNKFLDKLGVKFLKRKNMYGNLVPYWGSEWWMLNSDAVKILVDEYFSKYHDKLKHTLCMDEMIWQTILLNSSVKDSIVNDNKWYITWNDHKKGLNDGNPDILTSSDFDQIVKSDKLMARKFDSDVDSEIFDLLDKHCGR